MTTDHTFFQHGDEPDAANFALAHGVSTRTSYIVNGFSFTVDFVENSLDVSEGTASIHRGDMETASQNIDPSETRSYTGHPIEKEAETGLDIPDGTVSSVYLDANIGSTDSPRIEVGDVPPSDESLKLGEVDTTEETVSDQWFLVTYDGTLTFPDEDAVLSVIDDLRPGTVVFERHEQDHFAVIEGGELASIAGGGTDPQSGPIRRVLYDDEEMTIQEEESMIVLDYFDAQGDLTVNGDMLIMEEEEG